jgi:hypothetical protein
LALEKSTAASLFWTLDQMKEMTSELAIAGTHPYFNLHCQVDNRRAVELVEPNEVMNAPGIAICGA